MSEEILKVENLKTYFFTASGVAKAVDGVSYTLKKGEILGIVGESGSGKSVSASSVIRLLPKTGRVVDGTILFEGKDMRNISDKELRKIRGNDISVIFQDPMTSLDPVFKVGSQMVELIRTHNNVSKEEARKIAVENLALVGIPDPERRMNAYPHELSGGMCQRVMIAMAISCHPKFMIADEPTTALEKTNTAIMLITHNLGIVWKMCDTVMVMYAGKTVEFADMKELYKNPLHPYTWGLLDSIPKLSDTEKAELKTIPGTPPDLRLTGKCCNFYNRCPYATDICREQVPELIEVAPGHKVACHHQNGVETLVRGKETASYE